MASNPSRAQALSASLRTLAPHERLLPRLAVLARRNHCLRAPLRDHLVVRTAVVGTIGAAAGQGLFGRCLSQQLKRARAGAVGQLHIQCLLAPTHGAEVGHFPIQLRQPQQPLNQTQTLAQSQVEQALDAQAELDRCRAENLLAPPLVNGQQRVPAHVFVQSDRQRPPVLDGGVVLGPVRGLVARLGALGSIMGRGYQVAG